MRTFPIYIISLFISLNSSFAQYKKSYPKDLEKIDSVVGHFGRSHDENESVSWIIALKKSGELLIQNASHHPVTRTRFYPTGNWKINGDTLELNINKEFFDHDCLESVYNIKPFLTGHILVPLNSDVNINQIISDLELEYESQLKDYKEDTDYEYIKNKILSSVFRNRYYQYPLGIINLD